MSQRGRFYKQESSKKRNWTFQTTENARYFNRLETQRERVHVLKMGGLLTIKFIFLIKLKS